jgi:Family of unknown function (DUF6270)
LAAPVPITRLFAREVSVKFKERCVIHDISKQHFDLLRPVTSDYLLLDLIDERHWVMVVDGSYLCCSVPFLRMAKELDLNVTGFERRSPYDPRVIAETLANIPIFIRRLRANVEPRRIILHEALWATSYFDSEGALKTFPNIAEVVLANDLLTQYYTKMKSEGQLPSILLTEDVRVADARHRWTLGPCHYADIYYRAFLTELDRMTQ